MSLSTIMSCGGVDKKAIFYNAIQLFYTAQVWKQKSVPSDIIDDHCHYCKTRVTHTKLACVYHLGV